MEIRAVIGVIWMLRDHNWQPQSHFTPCSLIGLLTDIVGEFQSRRLTKYGKCYCFYFQPPKATYWNKNPYFTVNLGHNLGFEPEISHTEWSPLCKFVPLQIFLFEDRWMAKNSKKIEKKKEIKVVNAGWILAPCSMILSTSAMDIRILQPNYKRLAQTCCWFRAVTVKSGKCIV